MHSLPNPEFPEFLVEWKAPFEKIPLISLSCKLVPVLYREYELWSIDRESLESNTSLSTGLVLLSGVLRYRKLSTDINPARRIHGLKRKRGGGEESSGPRSKKNNSCCSKENETSVYRLKP